MSSAKILIQRGRESLKDSDYGTLHQTQNKMMELLLGNSLQQDERIALQELRCEVVSMLNAHDDNDISDLSKISRVDGEQQAKDLQRSIDDKNALLQSDEISLAYREQLTSEVHGLMNVQRVANGEEYIPYFQETANEESGESGESGEGEPV